MAAYHRVYDSHHLQADCQEPGSAPEPYLGNRVWATFTFFMFQCSLQWCPVKTSPMLTLPSQNGRHALWVLAVLIVGTQCKAYLNFIKMHSNHTGSVCICMIHNDHMGSVCICMIHAVIKAGSAIGEQTRGHFNFPRPCCHKAVLTGGLLTGIAHCCNG